MMKKNLLRQIKKSTARINFFPLARVLVAYNREKFEGDLRAGISVAMLSFSMSIAYAMIAGLPISYGLFGCIVAAFVSFIFSSSRFIMFGPSNASAVMLMSAFLTLGLTTEEARVEVVGALVILVGIFLAVASIFKITGFVRYVSRTVVSGYIMAGAMLIIANQSANVLGIKDCSANGGFIATLKATFARLDSANWQAVVIALTAVFALFASKKFFKRLPAQAVALVVASLVCFAATKYFGFDLQYINSVVVSDWKISVPNFSVVEFRSLVVSALAVALFCVIESTSIGKSLAAKNAERLDTNQELFSLGMANIAASVFSGTVESGSLTRSAAGAEAGTKTTVVNLFSALFMLAGILIFGKLIGYIPKPALSAVIIVIAFSLFAKKAIRLAMRSTKEDRAVFLLTFLTGIIAGLDDAIYVGVAASIILFLTKASTPEVVEVAISDNGEEERISKRTRQQTAISIVHIGGNMFFGASEVFQDQIRLICESPKLKVLLLKMANAINFDATCAGDIEEIAIQMRRRNGVLLLSEVQPEILAVLKSSGVANSVGEENIFAHTPDNTTLSTALALRQAKKYLNAEDSNVQIIV